MGLVAVILDTLRRLTGSDGLDVTEYVAEIERHFSVKLAPLEIESTHTLGDMSGLIVRKLRERGRADTEDDVWPLLRQITSEQFGLDPHELNPNTRYVEDLLC